MRTEKTINQIENEKDFKDGFKSGLIIAGASSVLGAGVGLGAYFGEDSVKGMLIGAATFSGTLTCLFSFIDSARGPGRMVGGAVVGTALAFTAVAAGKLPNPLDDVSHKIRDTLPKKEGLAQTDRSGFCANGKPPVLVWNKENKQIPSCQP